ncbi:2OG-Fe dioxygenase family protein [Caulobacter sp. 602-2]|uniref:2OG-Fe dioxygenase family protein n=1 Tax=Caulobacter sp. 602-2 TaxID=2710887 RepID=A0A6G4R416_9CAUL|nr:2OG-Fe dioxygenase family protein [Caulobacter sp. 602-2]NGM52531.1 2OG-Fe dioxygenase family protein [Caulobacter sp. 602-2]
MIAEKIAADGFAIVPAGETRALLGGLTDWDLFADSWNDLGVDGFMADGGRYRRRRFAAFAVGADGAIARKPHQPHYQSRDYNALNGGVQRWFEPVTQAIAEHPVTQGLLKAGLETFQPLTAQPPKAWHVELHQFRIEAHDGQAGLPTPEGAHRDGVDWVIVMLVERRNVASGVTDIFAPDGASLGSFTLVEPGDAVLIDDHRVLHGVTAIRPLRAGEEARRDVLVVTFRRED